MSAVIYKDLPPDEWRKIRRRGLGASEIADVVGLGFRTPAALADLKRRGEAEEETPIMLQIGTEVEPLIARLYEKRMGCELQRCESLYQSDIRSWQVATPDRSWFGNDGHLVELKTVFYGSDEWGEELTDEIPAKYLCQVQWQMGVVGAYLCDVAALFVPRELRVYRVHYSRALFDLLTDAGGEFVHAVAGGKPLPDSWRPSVATAITVATERVPQGFTLLPPIADDYLDEYLESKRDEEYHGNEAELAKEKLLGLLGSHELGQTPRGGTIKRKAISRKAYTVESASYIQTTIRGPKRERT
jgi:putative phage-type endonuclease